MEPTADELLESLKRYVRQGSSSELLASGYWFASPADDRLKRLKLRGVIGEKRDGEPHLAVVEIGHYIGSPGFGISYEWVNSIQEAIDKTGYKSVKAWKEAGWSTARARQSKRSDVTVRGNPASDQVAKGISEWLMRGSMELAMPKLPDIASLASKQALSQGISPASIMLDLSRTHS